MRATSDFFGRLNSDCAFPRGSLIAAAAVLLILSFCVPRLNAANSVTFTPPANVSRDGSGTVPQIAVDSSGDIDIAYGDVSSLSNCTPTRFCPWTGTIAFRRSTDGGKTFSAPVVLAQKGGPFSMALESDCTIDISYFANGDVFFAQSTDCGSSFSPLNVTNTGAISLGSAIEMVVNQKVAEIAWQVGDGTPSSIDYAQGNSTGFTAPRVLATQGEGAMGLFGMALSNGTTDIMWWAGEFSYGINFLNNVNGGQPATVAGSGISSGPFFSLAPSGNMNIAWGVQDFDGNSVVRFVRSIGQSGALGSPQTVSIGNSPGIATDPQGDIGIAFFGVQFTRSTDGGATFSTPVPVNAGVAGTVSEPPQVVLPSSSFAGVAWGQGSNLWFNSSADGGSTFSRPVNITNNQSNPTVLQMMTDSAGDVLMVWSENDANGHDVFFARSVPPDFTISAAPAAQTVLAGGAAKFTVTLTATGGFSDFVNLSCSKLPSGAECAFDSSKIALNTSALHSSLTVTTPPTLGQGNYTFTIDAVSGSITHTQDLQVGVGGITSSIKPSSAVIAAGSSGNFDVNLAPTNGFSGPVTLSCSGAPTGMDCSFNPAQPSLAANAGTAAVLTVKVAAKPSTSIAPGAPDNGPPPSSRHLPLMLAALALLAAATLLTSATFRPSVILSGVAARFFSSDRVSGPRGRAAKNLSSRYSHALPLATFASALLLAISLVSCSGATTTSNRTPGGAGTTASATGASGSGSGGTTGTSGSGGTGGSTGAGGSGSGGTGSSGGTGGSGGSGSGGSGSGSGGSGGGSSVTTQFAVQAQSGDATVNLGTISVTVP